jgi:hypothetical protein
MDDIAEVYERNSALVLAAEDWAPQYRSNEQSFNKLIKAESKINRVMLEYLKGLAERAPRFVDWRRYNANLPTKAAKADNFEVNVIVSEIPDSEDSIILGIMFDPVGAAVASGLQAAESSYKIILPDTTIPELIDQVAKQNIAFLVGKKVDSNGNIVDNPKAKYRISDKTRDQIRDSIRTSLNLGEDQQQATSRLMDRIKDPERAARIAATESVNAYSGGNFAYAQATNAVKKEWRQLSSACNLCLGNAAVGPIDINDLFPSGHLYPSCHPYDRCHVRYIYAEELQAV